MLDRNAMTETVRQLLQRDHLTLRLAIWQRGGAEPFFGVWNVVHHAGLPRNHHLVQVRGSTGCELRMEDGKKEQ